MRRLLYFRLAVNRFVRLTASLINHISILAAAGRQSPARRLPQFTMHARRLFARSIYRARDRVPLTPHSI
jgi:hypothetical protein